MLVSPQEHDPLLRALGQSHQLCERLGVDFLFYGKTGLIGVQRKRVDDLVASIRGDDRLARELGQMESLSQAVVCIEGAWRWKPNGESLRVRGFTRAQYHGVILALQAAGVWVMTTADTAETAAVLAQAETWFAHAEHDSLRRRKKPGGSREGDWRDAHLLSSFEGVSLKRAKAIREHFGRVPLRWDCTETELTAVPGIGRVTARRLLASLNGGDE